MRTWRQVAASVKITSAVGENLTRGETSSAADVFKAEGSYELADSAGVLA